MARAPAPEVVHLDTHVVCWLYEGRTELLSPRAAEAIERGRLFVSPIVDLELQFLHQIGRISKGPEPILRALADDLGLQVEAAAFARIATQARGLGWTRDPFDRLIVAQAGLARAGLVSKDRLIRRHYPAALW